MDHNLQQLLLPLFILGSLGTSVYFVTKLLTEYILKKKMIEKGFVNDETQAIFKRNLQDNRYSSLKWGLIVFFAGLSFIIMEYLPVTPESPLPYGLFMISVSLGFLIYYFIVRKVK